MYFKPFDKTIKDLLSSGHQFVIPRFQREYSWERKHYSEFLKDIFSNLNLVGKKISVSPYFVGTMLFIGDFLEADKKPIEVVDGQQRLTTITILFSALSDIFKSRGYDTLAERVFQYIMTKDDNGDPIKVLSSKSTYPYFAYFIQDFFKENASIEPNSEEEANIKATYEYFVSQLEEHKLRSVLKSYLNKEVRNIDYIDILKAIRDQVLSCSFVAISTANKDQANRIFEILNAKGKRLDSVDLIKNSIFEVAFDLEPVDVAEDLWNKIKQKIEDPDVGVGIATFYRHFWASKYKKSTSSGLYRDFKSVITPRTKERYITFLKEMVEYAELYVQIINPSLQDYDNKQQYAWLVQSFQTLTNDFNIVQVRIPFMALLDAKNRRVITTATFKKVVQYLEGFHFAFSTLTAGRANRTDSLFSQFAISLHKAKNKEESKHSIDILLDKLNALYPDYQAFKDAFIKLSYSKKNEAINVLARYALRKLSCFFSNQDSIPLGLTVEHIKPESLAKECTNIGNLILLESNLNEEADDMCYEEKKQIYSKSKQEWVAYFLKEHESWVIADFSKRAEQMAFIFYKNVLGRKMNH